MRHLMIVTSVLLAAPSGYALAGDVSWLFLPGRYSHDPATGQRVDQFAAKPFIPAFPDASPVRSGYNISRVNQLGTDGSQDTYYRVDNWGNGQGGFDAQSERGRDLWREDVRTLGEAGYFRNRGPSIYNQGPIFVDPRRGYGYGGDYAPLPPQ